MQRGGFLRPPGANFFPIPSSLFPIRRVGCTTAHRTIRPISRRAGCPHPAASRRMEPPGLQPIAPGSGGMWACRPSVSKKSFRHAVRIFKLSKKFKNTCRLNAKGAFCPLHTSPAALSQTSSARFFDSLRRHVGMPPYGVCGQRTASDTVDCGPMWASAPTGTPVALS